MRRPARCGERIAYTRGCRCEACREAQRRYLSEYRERVGVRRTAAQVAGEKRYEMKRRLKRRGITITGRIISVRQHRIADGDRAGDD